MVLIADSGPHYIQYLAVKKRALPTFRYTLGNGKRRPATRVGFVCTNVGIDKSSRSPNVA